MVLLNQSMLKVISKMIRWNLLMLTYARESLAADAGKKIDGDPSPLDLQGAAPLMKSLHPGSKQHRRQLENLEDDINQALEAITPTSWL